MNAKAKENLKEIGLILAFGIINGLLGCPSCLYENPLKMLQIVGISCLIWLVMWKGNSFTSHLVDHYYSWLKDPVKRLIYGVLGHTLYTSLAVVVFLYGFEYAFNIRFGRMPDTLFISIFFALLISTILHSRQFLISWRRLAVESEKIKKEAISSKYETLKNQVNPHFLFNSLNALSNLVYEDQDLAAKFIKKLSEVYRYVLESRDKELVPLATELEFVGSYIFLQKIRYEENLFIDINVNSHQNIFIVPLALQMLVENAIKHNEISEEHPLKVSIIQKNDLLEVRNNLQKKNIIKENSSEVGLSNIKARYSFLSDNQVTVEETEGDFIVRLPLIKNN